MKVEPIYQIVGERIRVAREKRNLSQADLAELVSLSRTSITNAERGRQRLLLHTLYDIAIALGTDPRDLLPDDIESPPSEALEDDLLKDLSLKERSWIRAVIGTEKGDLRDYSQEANR